MLLLPFDDRRETSTALPSVPRLIRRWWTHATVNTGDTLAIFKVLDNPSVHGTVPKNPAGPLEHIEWTAAMHSNKWLKDGPALVQS